MLLFMERKGAPKGEPGGPAEMKKFAGELASQGKLRRGAPLVAESAGARVRVRDGKAFVSDGPFAESKEIVGGFWIIEAASREEAIEIARRCPHARHGVVEVHLVRWRDTAADPEKGIPFLFAFHTEPGLTDPDGSKMREMIGFGEALKRDGKFLETAPLAHDPPPARIEPRGGKTLVTDGPFAEAKESLAGFWVFDVAGEARAIELASRVVVWAQRVELREVPAGPPEV